MSQNPKLNGDESGGRLFWKITLTVVCAIAAGMLLLYICHVM